nr:TetR/AcrR family transcriptional regulator [Schumannella luteola]
MREFTSAGYAGTSIQRIADLAGVSKAAVLYHFASKEELLTAAIEPALDEIEIVLQRLHGAGDQGDDEGVRAFVTEFVDFLLRRPLEVHLFINQSRSLRDIPAIARAEGFMTGIAQYCQQRLDDPEDRVRVAIALAGSAYAIAASRDYGPFDGDAAAASATGSASDGATDASAVLINPTGFEGEAVRTSLIQVMTEILAPTPIARRS